MNNTNFTTSITIQQSPMAVFEAINNVRGWWSDEIEGSTDVRDAVFYYHFQDVHRCTIKITELVPGQKVTWLVLDNYFKFTNDKNEWNGNRISFEISDTGNGTQLLFTQTGLVPAYECYDICEKAWTQYVQQSLLSLITTGKGQPNAKDKPQTEDEKNLSQK
jgi:hypothetical protein